MSFVSYPCLILQISGQTLQVTVARENFWQLNGLLVLSISTYFLKKREYFRLASKRGMVKLHMLALRRRVV